MGRYSESVGVWKHTIYGIGGKAVEHDIVPVEEDNVKFVEIKKKAALEKDEQVLVKGVGDLYFDMIIRSDDTYTEEDKKELKTLISMNINQIVTDFMIAFKWTTQEKLDKMEKGQLKVEEEILKKKLQMSLEEPKLKSAPLGKE